MMIVALVALQSCCSAEDARGAGPAAGQCCQKVAHADCWGFRPGADSAASIQAAIDCPLARTVVVKNMGTPWVVGLPHLHLPVDEHNMSTYVYRAAVNFSTPNQLVIFQPGVVVGLGRIVALY
jgi:hypothetical protein